MGAAFGCRAVQQPQRWLHLTCLSLLRALVVLVCSMNWERHDELETEGEGEGGRKGRKRGKKVCVAVAMMRSPNLNPLGLKSNSGAKACCEGRTNHPMGDMRGEIW